MKAPAFWFKKGSFVAQLLMPLAWLYQTISQRVIQKKPLRTAPVPVVSIGNVTLGGTGKTPIIMAIAHTLKVKSPHILTRGYKARPKNDKGQSLKNIPLLVNDKSQAMQVGDEAKLLARVAPTWVCAQREKAALKATEAGAQLLLLDDAHQHSRLKKDVQILVFRGSECLGNSMVFPAGPLREALNSALERAQVIINTGTNPLNLKTTLPIFKATLNLHLPAQFCKEHPKTLAFCGLGNPQQFYNSLSLKGVKILKTLSFRDHYTYTPKTCKKLESYLQAGYQLICTEKDWVKLPKALQHSVYVAELKCDLPQAFYTWLKERINTHA